MVGIKHHTQTAQPDDPAYDVSKDEWNEEHDAGAIADVLTDHNKAAHDALGIDADTVDTKHAADLVLTADHTKAAHDALNIDADTVDTKHTADFVLTADHTKAAHEALGLDIESLTGTADDDQFEGTAGTQANTPNTSLWNVAGTARKVLVYDTTTGKPKWDYLVAYEVHNPAQILTFTAKPTGAYPDGTNSVAMVASAGTDTPYFTMTYQGTCTACSIDIQAETGNPSAEVNPADYPSTVADPYATHTGPVTNRKTSAVASYVTFRATATVDGQSKTKDVTIYYYNERLWGVSAVDDIDTQAEIDTFRTAQNKELSNSRAKSFTVTAGANEYIYYILREALGTPVFTVGGFEGGFSKTGDFNWENPRGFTEAYDIWRSDNHSLGETTVVVT